MDISNETKRLIQAGLAIAILVALVRLGLIWRERHEPMPQATVVRPLSPEAYVVPKRLHAFDLKSARQITEHPVWVKEGYRYVYYAYDPVHHRCDLRKEMGRLGPIEELQIKQVVLDKSPEAPGEHQIMAAFEKHGNWYAFAVGAELHGDYRIYIDEILFLDDPHQLYSFWPAEVWHAIDQREVKAGMNEIQASFALGVGLLERDTQEERVLRYPNGGNTVVVTYHKGKAVLIVHPNSPLESA